MRKNILILGAGGFIGSNLVKKLHDEGNFVIGADLTLHKFGPTYVDDFKFGDLRDLKFCKSLFSIYKWDEVYQLAADMGGANYIFTKEHDADIMHNSAQINLNIAEIASSIGVGKLFYSSSACIYPEHKQLETNCSLKESDAIPADPDSCYGWEKLFSEKIYDAYRRNKGLNVRIARFHNIFGENGSIDSLKSKAPAAICRKVVESDGKISIMGDGTQTRSFLYIDECLEGVERLMNSDYHQPLNIGSDEQISINNLAKMVIDISGKNIEVENFPSPATGVMGRNSDNSLIESILGWKPSQPLRVGMEKLYNWVNEQVNGKKD